MALKIIQNLEKKDENMEEQKESNRWKAPAKWKKDKSHQQVEPYILGELTNYGGLEIGIIESQYTDRFNCLETPTDMLNAFNTQDEFRDRLAVD